MRIRTVAMISALLPWVIMIMASPIQAASFKTEANVMVELIFTADRSYTDPFNQVILDVTFIDPKSKVFRVPAFWAGGNTWKVRYSSPHVGAHKFRSECSENGDEGLHGISGKVQVMPYSGTNPLYAHGPIQVAPDRRHFVHADGTPFFWLGDTWWMGLSKRLHWPEDVQKLAADRRQKGFNAIQLVAGLFPDMHPFDPRGANEAGYPWTTNYGTIRPEYFDAADKRLLYLVDQGFTPCIVGAWGYFLPWMGVDKANAHWRYLIARYGALPVVWCTAGEANLPWYLAEGFPYDDRKQVEGWTEVTRYLRKTDPFHRPITIHPTGIGRLSARHAMNDLSLIDIDMLQTPHGQRDAVAPTINTVRTSYTDQPVMPVINGEASFEMLGDNLPTQWTRQMFWLCLLNGAAGHTYGANGIWQVNRRGDPHGPSPHHNGGNGYGIIPWDEAMNLPGSQQVAYGRKLFEAYPWQKFQPHPEWATFAETSSLSFEGSSWIWFPEGNPASDAPAEKRFYRLSFVVPPGKAIKKALLRVSADDKFVAHLNGSELGGATDWNTGKQFNDLVHHLKPGTNILAVMAENVPFNGDNPAGLIAIGEIHLAGGELVKLASDDSWRCSKLETAGWNTANFDDSEWPHAKVLGVFGGAPWGRPQQSNDPIYGPQCAGVPGGVRIIYIPENVPINVNSLGSGASYTASYFNPVTGAKSAIGLINADASGCWACPPPSGVNHDWVLVLEGKGSKAVSSNNKPAGTKQ